MGLVVDDIRKAKGFCLGNALWVKPENQSMQIDYTSQMGSCSNLYYSLIFQMPKWGFRMAKVDEFMTVTPTHAETYNLTITQKQKLEGSIKQGLASIAQAVGDYELISHDYRRYKEIYDYFLKGEKDEHVLRSLFVDRVDAFTGENYSMVTMARRWPTIITDFIRMDPKMEDVNQIRQQLDVSNAEATVLKTKNELYKEWKRIFKPVVEERLARFKAVMEARKTSINQYKSWLKPYIARHKMMKDALEESPAGERTSRFMTPGFAQAVAGTGIRLWVWKPFITEERQRSEALSEEMGTYINAKGEKKKKAKFRIDPYDDWVKGYLKIINEKYKINITDAHVEDLKNEALGFGFGGSPPHVQRMDPNELYYLFFNINLDRSIIKTAPPAGGELEDMMFSPLETMVMSQNVLLLHLIELKAIEMSFEREINEIIGITGSQDEILKEVREELYGKEKEQKKMGIKELVEIIGKTTNRTVGIFRPFSKYFFKQGPYETNVKERITKIYMVGSGQQFGEFVKWIKGKMGA